MSKFNFKPFDGSSYENINPENMSEKDKKILDILLDFKNNASKTKDEIVNSLDKDDDYVELYILIPIIKQEKVVEEGEEGVRAKSLAMMGSHMQTPGHADLIVKNMANVLFNYFINSAMGLRIFLEIEDAIERNGGLQKIGLDLLQKEMAKSLETLKKKFNPDKNEEDEERE